MAKTATAKQQAHDSTSSNNSNDDMGYAAMGTRDNGYNNNLEIHLKSNNQPAAATSVKASASVIAATA